MLKIRNIAIIAHVDHGKTTLIDNMLKQSGTFRDNQEVKERLMDSGDIEKERGITILAKCTSIHFKDMKYNIIDTPGHADFSGEVERILSMIDGAIVLVDSAEGVMPQTKFVLSKALALGLKPIVIINKMDKPDRRVKEVLDEILELFIGLDANDEQIEFPILYASGRSGWASEYEDKIGDNLTVLFELIEKYVPEPKIHQNNKFSMLTSILTSDDYLGRILIGKVYSGTAEVGNSMKSINLEGNLVENFKLTKLLGFRGVEKIPIDKAYAGDIIAVSGTKATTVSDTICDNDINTPIPSIKVDPPTMAISISVNSSPFAGKEGTKVTSRMVFARLKNEAETNVAITLKSSESGDSFEIGGRGELQLGVLIENMRREGFELSVAKPKVLLKKEEELLEPIEEVVIDVDQEYSGIVIEKLSQRKGDLQEMKPYSGNKTRVIFYIPSRGLIGYQSEFRNDTRGTGILNRVFYRYEKFRGKIFSRRNGVLISNLTGEATAYALSNLEDRGILFIQPGTKVYEGMIVGEHNRENDLEVNVVKAKNLTNVRASGSDEQVKLAPPRTFSLEETLSYIRDDELVEVTPQNIRLRKAFLSSNERKRMSKQNS